MIIAIDAVPRRSDSSVALVVEYLGDAFHGVTANGSTFALRKSVSC
ncbi:hypothetical protein HQP42_15180 [Rhodococcus fascians]|nr:hypothetical protein [Rhodococcus fascians]MBY3826485.1 hypothetical protein [Rhodococcus fascians]MBY3836947.1 hypothetical protein [Rhodococcus fascians]MBY3865586.1 hypothetical protein [Rhodococcus fascians]MBY3885629.1 hypothetical protein [Rhodococcus fascians]